MCGENRDGKKRSSGTRGKGSKLKRHIPNIRLENLNRIRRGDRLNSRNPAGFMTGTLQTKLEAFVIEQIVVGNHSMSSLFQNLQGHVEIVHRKSNRPFSVTSINQRIGVVDVDFGLQQRSA